MAERNEMKVFYELLKDLKKKHAGKNVFKILTTIRSHVEWPQHKQQISQFKAMNCYVDVLQILKTAEKQTIDVALGIIGNCVMEDKDSKEFLSERSVIRSSIDNNNILAALINLMKRYPGDKSINGGIFVILANMCMCREDYAYIIISRHPQFVRCVLNLLEVSTIDKNFCETTVARALRLLRMLLNRRTVSTLLEHLKVLNGVCSFFIKIAAEWKKTGEKEYILKQTIKVLENFSGYDSYHIFSNTKNSEGENCLLCLSKVVLLVPKDILQIFRNFMMVDCQVPVLEASNLLNDVLLNSDLQELGYDGRIYIEFLCSLMNAPFKRYLEQCKLCVKVLIKAIRSFKYISKEEMECFLLILRAFNSWQDADILMEQINCSAIEVLTSSLGRALEMSDDPKFKVENIFKKLGNGDSEVGDIRRNLILETTDLISTYRRVQPFHPQLGSKELVLRMTQLIPYFPNGNVHQLNIIDHLSDILNCPANLCPLLETNIIELIYNMSSQGTRLSYGFMGFNNHGNWAESLIRCISCVAKSEPAHGNFEKALMEGEQNMREQMALVIPYIAKGRTLFHLMETCGGLEIMVKLIEQDGKYRKASITSISFLARRILGISKHEYEVDKTSVEISKTSVQILSSQTDEEKATFRMDDGSVIRAKHELLIEKSEYFAAIFSGRFMETAHGEIEIHDVQSETFQRVLNLLVDKNYGEHKMEDLLDALLLSDRFLLTELCTSLCQWISDAGMKPNTVSAIYQLSVLAGLEQLRTNAIKFALAFDGDDTTREVMFHELFELECTDELFGDISNTLKKSLQMFNESLESSTMEGVTDPLYGTWLTHIIPDDLYWAYQYSN